MSRKRESLSFNLHGSRKGLSFHLNLVYLCLLTATTTDTRGLIKGQVRDLAINLPGCFRLFFLLSFITKPKNARMKNPTDLQHKNLMKPLGHKILGNWYVKIWKIKKKLTFHVHAVLLQLQYCIHPKVHSHDMQVKFADYLEKTNMVPW